ncbi:hypothetical protein BT69DRAFT_1275510 [Atractiella rhizophila]|nr:hypothetical protein BT69DRAFT_1275510 [Atractiella rhizophila]
MRTGFHQEWNLKTRSLKAALSNGLHKRQRTVDTHSLATNINTNISSSLPSKFKEHPPTFDVDMFAVDKQAAPLVLAPAGFTGWRSILIKRAKSAVALLLGIAFLLYLFSSDSPSPFPSTFSLSRPPHPHPAVEPEINNSLDADLLVPAAFSSEKETEETLKCPSLHSAEQIHWSLSPASGEAEEEEELECEPILTLRQLSAKLWTYPRPNPFVVSQCRPPRHLRAQMACNSFVLRIQRKEGCHLPPIEGGGLTRNGQESTLAEELLGPDSFIIDITGSERKSIIRPFRFRRTPVDGEEEIGGGGCEYFFGVEVKNGGSPFRLAVNWVYENWDGMIESFERDGEVYLGKKYEGELVDEKIPR